MDFPVHFLFSVCLLFFIDLCTAEDSGSGSGSGSGSSFHENFDISWGHDHVVPLGNGGTRVQLTMDKFSGCGIMSKLKYGSGFFRMRLKLPQRDSTAVVTTYYLHSHTPHHDEVDFEFLGGREKIILQTNIYVNGVGGREQRVHLWFDPTRDFHTYSILWNQYQLVFYVDDIPIRVLKNNTRHGAGYPTQGMKIEGTLWNGEGWASNGMPIKWSEGPFKAIYEGFKIEGCPLEGPTKSKDCGSSDYWWNGEKYKQLDPKQQKAYEFVRRKYISYDYCSDWRRYPNLPLECEEQ